jgi:hypothetical protein
MVMSKAQWDIEQQLKYDVMPSWWYNRAECEASYSRYRKDALEWQQKEKMEQVRNECKINKRKWGQTTIDME